MSLLNKALKNKLYHRNNSCDITTVDSPIKKSKQRPKKKIKSK